MAIIHVTVKYYRKKGLLGVFQNGGYTFFDIKDVEN